RLQSLGYLHGSGEGGEEIREVLLDEGVAPQDRVSDLNRMSAAKHLLFKERPVDALHYTRKLVETDGNSPMYLELHASALAGAGQLDESWEIVRELQATGTVSAELLMTLAAERFGRGDHAAAIEILEDFSGKTESARALWLLSGFYHQTQNPERALESLQRALRLNPKFAPARVDLAVHWARSGRPDRADAEFRLALSQSPYYAKGNFNYGAFLFENGDLQEARASFRRALDLAPGYLKAHLAMITVEYHNGNDEAARIALRSLQRIAPDSAEARIATEMLADQ
ncbi:MAG: tetratricopeptide repeat protein, partial [Wenzhouxiangellaceae bacterium]